MKYFFFHVCFFLFSICLMILVSFVDADQKRSNPTANRSIHPYFITQHDHRSLQTSNTFSNAITKLTASDGGALHYFGFDNSVAISNNRIVVGARGFNSYRGAAYLFFDPTNLASGRSYSQMAILTANDGQSGNYFGQSVDIYEDIIVVGAPGVRSFSGAVYVFRRLSNNNVVQIAKITAPNGAASDEFGYSVAVHKNFILVGAPLTDVMGSSNAGSAYLFLIVSSDPSNPNLMQHMQFQPNDLPQSAWFGSSVALNDGIAVVGTLDNAANTAYVFVPHAASSPWTQMAKLTGPSFSWFGNSVAIAENTIVVGALYEDSGGSNAGAVFVFNKMASTSSPIPVWTQTAKLLSADSSANDNFGRSVSISHDASTIVVGAGCDDPSSDLVDAGAAYFFKKNALTSTTADVWTQFAKFIANDGASFDNLGSSIAIEGSIVVVGAWVDDTAAGQNAGSAYVLDALDTKFLPTPQPSSTPSRTPSVSPSLIPSTRPSTTPSVKPSSAPSRMPSLLPSSSPSLLPSAKPSTTPSVKPSSTPTQLPSSMPSVSPSLLPSTSPSTMPSLLPSSLPSFRHSLVPVANTVNTGTAGIPWYKIFPLAASGALILGFLGCLLL